MSISDSAALCFETQSTLRVTKLGLKLGHPSQWT